MLTMTDLERGMVVTWEWSAGTKDLAERRNVRPIGRVVTHEDLLTMSAAVKIGIQTLDDPLWVIDPATILTKGRLLLPADPPVASSGPTL